MHTEEQVDKALGRKEPEKDPRITRVGFAQLTA